MYVFSSKGRKCVVKDKTFSRLKGFLISCIAVGVDMLASLHPPEVHVSVRSLVKSNACPVFSELWFSDLNLRCLQLL